MPVTRSQLPMNMCVVRVGEFLMNMMMFDPMGFGRGTPNVFRYRAVTTEHVSIFVRLPDKVKQCLLTIIPCLYIDMFDVCCLFNSLIVSDSLKSVINPCLHTG